MIWFVTFGLVLHCFAYMEIVLIFWVNMNILSFCYSRKCNKSNELPFLIVNSEFVGVEQDWGCLRNMTNSKISVLPESQLKGYRHPKRSNKRRIGNFERRHLISCIAQWLLEKIRNVNYALFPLSDAWNQFHLIKNMLKYNFFHFDTPCWNHINNNDSTQI